MADPIPNINIGEVYDQRYADRDVHYDSLKKLADFFGRNMPVHRHDRFFQLHYVRTGQVRVYLDETRYQQQGPMFFLTPPTVAHAFVTDAASDGHVLTVRQQLVWPLLEAVFGPGAEASIQPICVSLRDTTDPASIQQLDNLFTTLGQEFASHEPGHDQALHALTRFLLIRLLRLSRHALASRPAARQDLQLFRSFNQLIETHYREHWRLQQYAQALGITEARLNQICRRIADLPSKQLVSDRLMQEARRLLLFSGCSIKEICYQLGFSEPGYFNRFFLRHSGLPPGTWRSAQPSPDYN